jgi:hypothetical protein
MSKQTAMELCHYAAIQTHNTCRERSAVAHYTLFLVYETSEAYYPSDTVSQSVSPQSKGKPG